MNNINSVSVFSGGSPFRPSTFGLRISGSAGLLSSRLAVATDRSNPSGIGHSCPLRAHISEPRVEPAAKKRKRREKGKDPSGDAAGVTASPGGRKTDFFGADGRLSLTPRFSGVGVAREQAP